ncbi:EpsG family protein [Adlercreutzia sp. ZJ154]|uniref:EpsG family protein n=1 Tax=Adlercreutzia sp. ZJ154 TaxID=2709790 RepID=UPI0013EE2BAB|nr:EpsG family protein [Adlercreutzia sp. ZJ154]
MLVYLLIPIATVVLYGVDWVLMYRIKRYYLFLIAVFVLLAGISGCRSPYTGTDTMQYYTAFLSLNDMDLWNSLFGTRYEIGYAVFNRLVGLFTSNPQMFIFTESCITTALVLFFIARNSSNVLASVLVYECAYLYFQAFNASRFWLGLAIALCGFEYARKRCIVPALAFVVAGTSIHTSIAMLIIVYALFFMKRQVSDLFVFIMFCVAMILSLFGEQLMKIYMVLFERYTAYETYDLEASFAGFFPLFLLLLVATAIVLSQKDKLVDGDYLRRLSIPLLFSAALGFMSMDVEMATRMRPLFTVFLILFIPELGKLKHFGSFVEIVSLVALVFYGYTLLSVNDGQIVPYATWI